MPSKAGRHRYVPLSIIALAFALLVISTAASLSFVGKSFAGFRFEPTLTVSSVNLASWPGMRAGLAQQDRVVAINGRAASGSADLWRLVRSVPTGTPIRYRVTGDAGTRSISIPTVVFTASDWFQTVFPLALIGLLFLLIGAAGYWLKPDNATGRVHLYFTASLAIFMASNTDYDLRSLWSPFVALVGALFGSTALHLGLSFPVPLTVRRRPLRKLWIAYVPALLIGALGALLFRPLAAPANPLLDAYLAVYYGASYLWVLIGALTLVVSLIVSTLRPQSALAGQQAKVALYGAAMAFLPLTLLWLVPTLAGYDATSFVLPGTLFFVFFPASIVYAIVKTKLFDIDLVIKRTIQYALLATILGAIYFGTMLGSSYALQWVLPKGSSQLTDAVAAAVVAFAFTPLSNWMQRTLDRIFSRQQYHAAQLLAEFGERARAAIVPDELFHAFDGIVTRAFAPVFVGVSMTGGDHYERGTSGGFALSENIHMGDEVLGLAMVGEKRSDLPYNEADRVFWRSLCGNLAMAMKNLSLIRRVLAQERMAKEIEIAHEVQRGILPAHLPEIPGAKVSGFNEAALEMGGDFYDVIPLEGGAVGLVLGDVSGKGVPAAFLGAVCLTMFRAYAPLYRTPIETLQAVNEALIRYRPSSKMFIAITYAVYDPGTGIARVVNGGNPAPIHAGKALETRGMPLGARAKVQYRDFEVHLAENETLVLLSDGVTDARAPGDERYGEDRLHGVAGELATREPGELIAAVRQEIDGFRQQRALYDDFTILALQCTALPSGLSAETKEARVARPQLEAAGQPPATP